MRLDVYMPNGQFQQIECLRMDERAAIGNPAFFNTFSGAEARRASDPRGIKWSVFLRPHKGCPGLGEERGVDRGCVAGPMDASLPRRMPVGLDLVLVMAVALKVPPGSFAGERRSQR